MDKKKKIYVHIAILKIDPPESILRNIQVWRKRRPCCKDETKTAESRQEHKMANADTLALMFNSWNDGARRDGSM